MKKLISLLMIAALIVGSIGFVFATDLLADNKDNQTIIANELNKLIDNEMKAFRWSLVDSSFNVLSESINNGKLTVDYYVNIKHRLNYPSAKAVPVLKGQMKYLEELNADPKGNSEKIKFVNDKVNGWEKRLTSYINEDQELNETIRVTASLNHKNEIIKNTIEFAFQEGDDSFVSADEFLSVATEDKIYQDSYNDIKNKAKKVKEKDASGPIMSYVPTYDAYSHTAAVNYANTWVKTTSLVCQSGSSTLQNKANYNPNYAAYTCNDCANFVSQCLYAGGIPKNANGNTSTGWAPGYTPWINTGLNMYGLTDYMLEHGYAETTSFAGSVPGDFYAYTNISHVVFIVYNDGTTIKYNGHSSDRLATPITSSTSKVFYSISNIQLQY